MSSATSILLAFATGSVLGCFFFGGLWWTVSRVTSSRSGAWLLPVSSFLRTVVLLGGLWVVGHDSLGRIAACMAGWLLARRVLVRRYGPVENAARKRGPSCT